MTMNPVTLECPLCRGMIQVDALAAGLQVACPLCHGTMQVPPVEMLLGTAGPPPVVAPPPMRAGDPPVIGPPAAPMPVPPPASPPRAFAPLMTPVPLALVPLSCPSCGGTFQVPPSAAGMQLPCPMCGQLVTIREHGMAAASPVSPPPAAAIEPQPVRPSEPSAAAGPTDVTALLPPSASAGAAPPAEFSPSGSAPDVASLLPPGAAEGFAAGAPATMPLASRPILVSSSAVAASILVPTPDGSVVALADKPKVIGQGEQEVELKRLTPAEKARRRTVRNVILFLLGVAGLLAIVIYMSRR